MRATPGRQGAGWWGLAGAAVLAVLAPMLTIYAVNTHAELAWQLCYRVGTRPGRVWAAAIGAPVASLAALVGTSWLAAKAERRSALVVTAVVVAFVAGVFVLVEAFTAVGLLFVDDRNGDTCGL